MLHGDVNRVRDHKLNSGADAALAAIPRFSCTLRNRETKGAKTPCGAEWSCIRSFQQETTCGSIARALRQGSPKSQPHCGLTIESCTTAREAQRWH